MNAKTALDTMARAKLAYARRKNVECLGAMVMVLKGMDGKSYPVDLTSIMREMVNAIGREKAVVEVLGKPLVFQLGQEKAMLVALAKVYKFFVEAQAREDRDAVRRRKLNLDQCYNAGVKCVQHGEITEADKCFGDALTYYKDEHSLFAMIGETFMKANAPKRAFPYLSKGVIEAPDNAKIKELYEQCLLIKDKKE